MKNVSSRLRGFTLIELLVVIGIISVLISLLLPAVHRAKQEGLKVKCMAQMREVGVALRVYSNDNRGGLYPVGEYIPAQGNKPAQYETLGTETKWKIQYPNPPHPTDSATYHGRFLRWPNYVDLGVTPKVWDPPLLTCPADDQPAERHTYILNRHLATQRDKVARAGLGPRGRSDSDIVLMGEKRTESEDYYMGSKESDLASSEFDIVEPYRHGVRVGSNYLYLDNSVRLNPPKEALGSLDSWDPWPTTQQVTPPTP